MTIPLSIPQHERSHIVIPGGARAARQTYPTAGIDQMLEEIERGYLGTTAR